MLRKGIVALMMTVMSVGGSCAAEEQKASGLIGFLRGPSIGLPHKFESRNRKKAASGANNGVTHAVVADAERQVPEIRQTSSGAPEVELAPANSAPQPLPVQYERTAAVPTPQPRPRTFSGSATQTVSSQAPAPQQYQFVSDGEYIIGDNGYGGQAAVPAPGPGALYPSPRPGIPQQVGSTLIPHEAFHPHEMLYKHRYRAMYGPYYYQVHGGWMVTPFGVWSKEKWKLKGTTVDVNYKTHISPFAFFHPPVIR